MADDDAFSGSFDDYGSDFEEDQKAQRATRAAEEALSGGASLPEDDSAMQLAASPPGAARPSGASPLQQDPRGARGANGAGPVRSVARPAAGPSGSSSGGRLKPSAKAEHPAAAARRKGRGMASVDRSGHTGDAGS
ncbi:hypothetical protein FNF28_03472 [Cafeteria roenbergensis]|uniref:Uncharacterized protein n=1 Tax=Cafeteria roenbergensis TaxID=33653 RepID=A0A5A8DJ47_CAFRO|nr:hypothetical protein FNF28_03472 [Cafeteria roenbergensis]